MPGIITEVIAVGHAMAGFYGYVDELIHPNCYYKKERDVPIINGARALYAKIFEGRPIPLELRYAHESSEEKAVVTAATSIPEKEQYRPQKFLPEQYRLVGERFGKNIISHECQAAVIELQTYLNEINQAAPGVVSKVLYRYGHQNDAVRALCVLIMNAFMVLSKLDLTEATTLKEAKLYIDFLSCLKQEPGVVSALLKITETDAQKTPLFAIDKSCERLKCIRNCIVYHLSKQSILEHTNGLYEDINSLIGIGFTFSTYIVSNTPIAPTDLIMEPPVGAPKTTLAQLRKDLVGLLYASDPNSAVGSSLPRLATPPSPEGFHYDEQLTQWIGVPGLLLSNKKSGVYKAFQAEAFLQSYLRFCALLKTLGELRQALSHLQNLLRLGGDFIAAAVLSEPILLMMEMIRRLVGGLSEGYSTLTTIAEKGHSELCRKAKLSTDEQHWMENYNNFNDYLRHSAFQQALENHNDHLIKIEKILRGWARCPQEKREAFRQNQQGLADILTRVCTFMSTAFDGRYLRYGQNLSLTDGLLPIENVTPAPHDVQSEALSAPLQTLQVAFEAYATRHGYVFLNQALHKTRGSPYQCTHAQHSDLDHQQRAQWIHTCLSIIQASHSEFEAFKKLLQQVQFIQAGSELEKHFQSRDKKEGISAYVQKWTHFIETRLRELMSHKSSHIKELNMPPKETNPTVKPESQNAATVPVGNPPTTAVASPVVERRDPAVSLTDGQIVLKDHYRIVHDIQEYLKNHGPKKAVEPKDVPEVLEDLRTGCNALESINFKKLTSPFHQALYTLLLMPYKSELTTCRTIGNGWHVGWRDASLLSLRQCLIGVIIGLRNISEASEGTLDEAKIALIDMCLLAHLSLVAKELDWHKNIRDIFHGIYAKKFPHPGVEQALVLEAHDGANFKMVGELVCVTHEKVALQAQVTQLKTQAEKDKKETDKQLQEKDNTIQKRDATIQEQASTIQKRDATIQEQEKQQKALNETMQQYKSQLSTLGAQVKAFAEKGGRNPSATTTQPPPPAFNGSPLHGGSSASATPPAPSTLQ